MGESVFSVHHLVVLTEARPGSDETFIVPRTFTSILQLLLLF